MINIKIRNLLLVVSLVVSVIFSSCKKDDDNSSSNTSGNAPIANFVASHTNINEGTSITFTDNSTNVPTTWFWDFGDASTSTEQNPSHTYNTVGSYSVSFTANNIHGSDIITRTDYIIVNGSGTAPVANFSVNNTTIAEGENVTFTDQSTNTPTSWSWDFGDGGTSTQANPVHTFNSTGTYTISITATNAYGADTKTKTDYITVAHETFTDSRDGKTYNLVQIGDQVWMAENLNYTGSGIQHITDNSEWGNNAAYDGWRYYEDNENYGNTYGALYQWEAAKSACPSGWHLPTDEEWTQLENYLKENAYSYDGVIGNSGIAKSLASDSGWTISDNQGAVGNSDFSEYRNKTGFSALPSGTCNNSGFFDLGYGSDWWSATEDGSGDIYTRGFGFGQAIVVRYDWAKSNGYAVRCVSD